MKVILLVCVLTIACVCFGQEVKIVSEEPKKEYEHVSEEKSIGEESLQESKPLRENHLLKLNNNDTLKVKLVKDFAVQDGTKLGIIVVPDLPEKEVDSAYQSQNIFEIKESVTSAGLINENENSTIAENEILTTVANLEMGTETSAFVEERYDKSVNSDLTDILEMTTELPTTAKPERKSSKEENKPLEVSQITEIQNNFTSKKIFPTFDFDIVKQMDIEDQSNKVKRFLAQEPRMKTIERRTFNSWNLLDFGEEKHGSVVKITKEIPYPVPYSVEKKVPFPVKVAIDRPIPIEVPKPYPVTFEKNVFFPMREYIRAPYPVFKKMPYFIQILVDKPIPFHIPKPYPVYMEKKVPYPVEKQIPIPINIPVDRPTPVFFPLVRNVYYPIKKKVYYPAPISVDKPVAVPVEKPYPVYIETKVPTTVEEHLPYSVRGEENKIKSVISQNYNFQEENVAVKSFPDHNTKHIGTHVSPEFGVNDGTFVPTSISTNNGYDHTSLKKKEDNESQESKKDEQLQEIRTTQFLLEKEKTREEGNATKTYHDFGKKINI